MAKKAAGMADSVLLDVENSVMSTFDFLSGEHVVDDEDDNLRCLNADTYACSVY